MPIAITVNDAEGVRYSVFSGDVTGAELLQTYRRIYCASDVDPSLDGLVDMRAVRTLDVESASIWDLGRLLAGASAPGVPRRVALVAPTDFLFGTARMFEALASSQDRSTEYRAVRRMNEARAWVDLAPEPGAAPES